MWESAAQRSPHQKRTPPVTRPTALNGLGDKPGNPGAEPIRTLSRRFRSDLNGRITFASSRRTLLLQRTTSSRTSLGLFMITPVHSTDAYNRDRRPRQQRIHVPRKRDEPI